KIVVAGSARTATLGDFALVRYNSDGSLDTTFGNGGKVTTDFFGANDSASAVVITGGGKIVVAGVAFSAGLPDFALARYNADGSLDSSFGSAGKTVVAFAGASAEAMALGLQANGKIIAAGSALSPVGIDFALARFDASGLLDPAFGTSGKLTTDFSGGADFG